MTSLAAFFEVAAAVLLVPTLVGTLYLAVLTLAGSLPARRRAAGALPGRLAIVVPAHNEAAGIRRTIDNLIAIARADGDAIRIGEVAVGRMRARMRATSSFGLNGLTM